MPQLHNCLICETWVFLVFCIGFLVLDCIPRVLGLEKDAIFSNKRFYSWDSAPGFVILQLCNAFMLVHCLILAYINYHMTNGHCLKFIVRQPPKWPGYMIESKVGKLGTWIQLAQLKINVVTRGSRFLFKLFLKCL